ncbi:MAG TPA: hypothetical protein ENK18_24910 [Deltaproteobacteria bacterium]|nr:hypothetical protein [Deltaproteobacteria bacterium]
MLRRLLGTETEYAIRFSPEPGVDHPGNEVLFSAIQEAVGSLVCTRPGQGLLDTMRHRVFTENGGSLYYEFMPRSPEGGLVEAGTPECRTPAQLLCYQRAQDRLLRTATHQAQHALARRGIDGQLALLKNCRDAQGNVYGAQENYEAILCSGPGRLLWALAVCAALPLALLAALIHLGLIISVLSLVVPLLFVGVFALAMSGHEDAVERCMRWFDWIGWIERPIATALYFPAVVWMAGAVRALAFRPYRRGALGFLVSRCVVTGAGTLGDDGQLVLSEKALAIRRLTRCTVDPDDRGLLEVGHLMKPLGALAWLDWRSVVALFRPRQRLQLGLSDANLCDVAELLKIGTTALVLDLVEAGQLDDAPVPADPVAACHAIARDPTLRRAIPLRGGGHATALQLQRFYQRRAEAWLAQTDTISIDAHGIVTRWGWVLDQLESDPDALFGHLDWITKAKLLDEASELEPAMRKKIDLRYHELGSGYHAWLDEAGLCPRLVADAEIERATRQPPPDTPASQRGRLIRSLSKAGTDAAVSWSTIKTGGKIIHLDEARRRRSAPSDEPNEP